MLAETTFVRDRFTWLAYFMLAFYAYMQTVLGPLVPFLRDELGLNYTVSGFHVSAFALGMVIAGSTADKLADRFGRRVIFWGGSLGMGTGGLLLIAGQSPLLTIPATFLMGLTGTLSLVMIQAMLADKYQAIRATALTESNVVAALFAACGPLLVGLGQSSGLGWRSAVIIAVLAWVMLFLLFGRVSLPESQQTSTATFSSRRLPPTFWKLWVVIFLSVAIEWCVIFWGSSFLETVVGLRKADASSVMSAFFIAVIIGRVAGSRLTYYAPSLVLLLGAIVLIILGFPIFWLAQTALLNITGLFILGLGVANLFPLGLSAASGSAPDQINKASARISLAAGTAILITPQILGSAADAIGINGAFAVIAVLIVLIAGVVGTIFLSDARQNPQSAST